MMLPIAKDISAADTNVILCQFQNTKSISYI